MLLDPVTLKRARPDLYEKAQRTNHIDAHLSEFAFYMRICQRINSFNVELRNTKYLEPAILRYLEA